MATLSQPDKNDLMYLYTKLLALHQKENFTPDDLEELIRRMREEQHLELLKLNLTPEDSANVVKNILNMT